MRHRNRGMLLIIFSLFFLSCDEDNKSSVLKGNYYIKTDTPVIVSINDKYENHVYLTSDEVDYSFTIYQEETNFVLYSCVKISSETIQNIHVEMTINGRDVKPHETKVFDIADDSFEYCY